ncbi:hypothetical protein [Paenibacillus bovis]|uniref:Uncharacterized protein n=1 Tax=Paenibacillus bovis TaxID=1616788 RepID=A0A1X9T3V3_9BACL|nr:hypothetical protein [Paenibacillus bovis]ARR10650.1 hypothetical protein AR543_p0042 [Paenibacillus bovis]
MIRTTLDVKLQESKHHYEHMIQYVNEKDLTKLKYEISAFINAARSILQYAHKTAKQQDKENVYKELVSANPTLKFFKDLRDENIHTKLVEVTAHANAEITMGFIIRQENTTDEEIEGIKAEQANQTPLQTRTIEQYFFDEKPEEEVLPLCEKYLVELEKFTAEAKVKGIAPVI